MRLIAFLVALSLTSLALAQRPRKMEDAWDHAARPAMENDGWQFRATFGIAERMCYALPPGLQWPEGFFGDQEVRDAAVAAGAIKFPPRVDDGKCHADDAPNFVPPPPPPDVPSPPDPPPDPPQ